MTTSDEQSNTGHGHVYPRADGVKARCGGPGLCEVCSADQARKQQEHAPADFDTATMSVKNYYHPTPDEVSFHPQPSEAINQPLTYAEHRRRLIEYLQAKVALSDWHGVSDAANDLRELEAHERGKSGR